MTLPRSYLEYARRQRGMDHDRYDYRSLFQHAPVAWPDQARVALVVVPIVEFFPLNMNPAQMVVKAVGGMERPYPDYWNYTTRDYGTRVGIYRIFKVLEQLGLPASVAINARAAQRQQFTCQVRIAGETDLAIALRRYQLADDVDADVEHVLQRVGVVRRDILLLCQRHAEPAPCEKEELVDLDIGRQPSAADRRHKCPGRILALRPAPFDADGCGDQQGGVQPSRPDQWFR